jgi:S1-C subfamily serine protease
MSQTDRDILKNGIKFDQTTVMGYPGSSGGAVFNLETGEVAGLLVRGIGPGLNFIVPTRRIIEFAEKADLRWAIDPTAKMPSLEELGGKVKHDGTLTIRQPASTTQSVRARGGSIIKLLVRALTK